MLPTLLSLLALAAPQAPDHGQDLVDGPVGLDRITPARVAADVNFLADPELGGRGMPSAGLEICAAFLELRLRRLGLEPGSGGTYRQAIPYDHRRIDREKTGLTLAGERGALRLAFGEDYYPERLAHLVDWDVSGSLVSVGYGRPEDLARCELEGRLAVLFEPPGARIRQQLQSMAAAGAVGVLVTPAPGEVPLNYERRFADIGRAMQQGLTTRPSSSRRGPDVPVVMLPRSGWERLAAHAGHDPAAMPSAGTQLGLEAHDRRAIIDPAPLATNVVGVLPGADASLAPILLVAHYDGVGRPGGLVHPGADDNGSGTAALLAVADALSQHGPLARPVVFLWTAGSQQGYLGARSFAAEPGWTEGTKPHLIIELDAIGGGPPDGLRTGPVPNDPWYSEWVTRFNSSATPEGFWSILDADETWPRSEARILATTFQCPSLLVTGGEQAYHRTVDDRPLRVSTKKVAGVARATFRFVLEAR